MRKAVEKKLPMLNAKLKELVTAWQQSHEGEARPLHLHLHLLAHHLHLHLHHEPPLPPPTPPLDSRRCGTTAGRCSS